MAGTSTSLLSGTGLKTRPYELKTRLYEHPPDRTGYLVAVFCATAGAFFSDCWYRSTP